MADEPLRDPRALLAIERTLLAWLRTGLSLITFGFLIARIGVWLRAQGSGGELHGSRFMGALFGALGAAANLLAIFRYVAFRKAILTNAARYVDEYWQSRSAMPGNGCALHPRRQRFKQLARCLDLFLADGHALDVDPEGDPLVLREGAHVCEDLQREVDRLA